RHLPLLDLTPFGTVTARDDGRAGLVCRPSRLLYSRERSIALIDRSVLVVSHNGPMDLLLGYRCACISATYRLSSWNQPNRSGLLAPRQSPAVSQSVAVPDR